MRKAQIEIMGLVIVVVLVTIGVFFSLALKQPDTSPKELDVYRNEKLASDFLITFLETRHAECPASMRDLAVDCVRFTSRGNGNFNCLEQDSCTALSEVLEDITSKTLDVWNVPYTLTFTYSFGGVDDDLITIDGGCTDFSEKSAPGLQPIVLYPTLPGQAHFLLEICR